MNRKRNAGRWGGLRVVAWLAAVFAANHGELRQTAGE